MNAMLNKKITNTYDSRICKVALRAKYRATKVNATRIEWRF